MAGAAGMVLVTISHATPIAIAVELAPAYLDASGAEQTSLAVTSDTLAQFCLLLNYFGDILIWGVTTPLFALAVLRTGAGAAVDRLGRTRRRVLRRLARPPLPRLEPRRGISTIGFLAFFLFTASLGVALLRRSTDATSAPAATSPV